MPDIPAPATVSLRAQNLTATHNKVRSPSSFLRRRLFNREKPAIATQLIEIRTKSRARQIAPFVQEGSEAIYIPGYSMDRRFVQPPNIRIKMPFEAWDTVYQGQQPGTDVYRNNGAIRSAIATWIADHVALLENDVQEAEEFLSAMALRGSFTILDTEGNAAFEINYGRPAGHNLAPARGFDDADYGPEELIQLINDINRLTIDETGQTVSVAILGSEAAKALRALIFTEKWKTLFSSDYRGLRFGTVELGRTEEIESGARYIGNIVGVDFWEYSRKTMVGGVSTDLIRPTYGEFLSTANNNGLAWQYAGIPDFDAPGGMQLGARFSKSWMTKDPSNLIHLLATRPMPLLENPGTTASVQLTS